MDFITKEIILSSIVILILGWWHCQTAYLRASVSLLMVTVLCSRSSQACLSFFSVIWDSVMAWAFWVNSWCSSWDTFNDEKIHEWARASLMKHAIQGKISTLKIVSSKYSKNKIPSEILILKPIYAKFN